MKTFGYYTNLRSEVYNALNLDPKFLALTSNVNHTVSILEFGSGSGAFFQNFDQYKFNYTGVDSNKKAVKFGKDQNLNINCCDWETFLKKNKKKFDIIIVNDFIEHTENHNIFISKAYEILVSGGLIVGSVPNLRFSPVLINLLVKRDFKYYTHGVLDETHLRFFTKKSLNRSLIENKFKISSLSMLNKIKPRSIKDLIALAASLILGVDTKFQQIFFVGVK